MIIYEAKRKKKPIIVTTLIVEIQKICPLKHTQINTNRLKPHCGNPTSSSIYIHNHTFSRLRFCALGSQIYWRVPHIRHRRIHIYSGVIFIYFVFFYLQSTKCETPSGERCASDKVACIVLLCRARTSNSNCVVCELLCFLHQHSRYMIIQKKTTL